MQKAKKLILIFTAFLFLFPLFSQEAETETDVETEAEITTEKAAFPGDFVMQFDPGGYIHPETKPLLATVATCSFVVCQRIAPVYAACPCSTATVQVKPRVAPTCTFAVAGDTLTPVTKLVSKVASVSGVTTLSNQSVQSVLPSLSSTTTPFARPPFVNAWIVFTPVYTTC